jgi:hypothetical protein
MPEYDGGGRVNWIDKNVAIGDWVDAGRINKLKRDGIELIVDARTLFERSPPCFRSVPMLDKVIHAAEMLVVLADMDAKVLVRCRRGRDRTPFVVMLYLSKKQGLSYREAYERVKQGRPVTVFHWEWVDLLEARSR